MIASLSGSVDAIIRPHIIITVSGVGYKVLISSDLLTNLKIGSSIKVYTYTYIREDALELFGFMNIADLQLFEKLISVSGVGPKTAMAIFSTGTRENIFHAIATADVSFFTTVPRLGKKNAQKIIIELKEKIGSIEELDLTEDEEKGTSDVVNALKGFGFTTQEVQQALKQVHGNDQSTSQKIRLALKYLGR